MASDKPKVLHEVAGVPLVQHLLGSLKRASSGNVVVVIGYGAERVKEALSQNEVKFVRQEEQRGTAHALKQAREEVESERFLVFPGDLPLVKSDSIADFIDVAVESGAGLSLLTTKREDPSGYGRIKRGGKGEVKEIVEEQDASEEEKEIKEINTGVYLLSNTEDIWLELGAIEPDNAQEELYLTDLVERLAEEGKEPTAVVSDAPDEFLGVNTREDLARAGGILNERKIRSLMEEGVTVTHPGKTVVEPGVEVGKDTIIRPFTILKGETKVGRTADVGPNLEAIDSKIGDRTDLSHSIVRNAVIPNGRSVAPFQEIGPD